MATITEEIAGDNGKRCSAVVWQDGDDDAVGEPALLVRTYYGSSDPIIAIQQGENEILLNASTITPLYRLIQRMVKRHNELNAE